MALCFVLRRDLASGEHQRLVPRPAQEVAPRGEVQLCSRRGANAEALQNACHEDKQLRLGEVLADADAVAKAKGQEVWGAAEGALRVQKVLGVELVRVLPVPRVAVDADLVERDSGAGGQAEAAHSHGLHGAVLHAQRHQAAHAHCLVQEGVQDWHGADVPVLWRAVLPKLVHNFRMDALLHLGLLREEHAHPGERHGGGLDSREEEVQDAGGQHLGVRQVGVGLPRLLLRQPVVHHAAGIAHVQAGLVLLNLLGDQGRDSLHLLHDGHLVQEGLGQPARQAAVRHHEPHPNRLHVELL
mmetsp:Transcript_13698/g.34485  ORF Transcript_13698/g.34485 Transcript_13698/m.34485 type:complete len:299 (+) Transcript_13698:217-1113(+)